MHHPANTETVLSMREIWNQKIQNLKILPIPSPPSPSLLLSPPESESTHQEQLEASNLLPPELLYAIQRKDVSDLVSVLEKITAHGSTGVHVSVIVDQVSRAGNTMLHVAAMYESPEILELIAHNFPQLITRRNIKGDTVLHVAARSGHKPELMRIVIECYLASNDDDEEELVLWRMKNKHGNMALHEAVMARNVEGVSMLFREDEGVTHLLNKEGKSALYLGVETTNSDILHILLQAPFLNRKIHQGTSPLHAAILAMNSGETKYPAPQPLVESWLRHQETLSIRVAPGCSERIKPHGQLKKFVDSISFPTSRSVLLLLLKTLTEKRSDLIYLKDQKGGTPLHCAASMGDLESVGIIVSAGPSSALEWNIKGYLPIHVACRKGHVNVVKELVRQAQFDPIESVNTKGQNILHIAAKRGKDRVVKYILGEKKLEILLNQKDKNGNTPLHLASKYLFPKVLVLLTREKKLNINNLNNQGMTARDIVMLNRKTPPTTRELLSYAILNSIGTPLSEEGRRLRRSQSKAPQVEWIKDRVSTILLVAILVATVTFTAGFTIPGGFNNSDHKDTKKIGMATLLNRRMFQLFTICDVIAMYSSTMGSFILLWAQLGDFHLAFSATYTALHLVALALVTMSTAFMAAIHLVVGDLSWLAYVVMIMGIVFILMFLALYILLTFPLGSRRFLLRHISNFIFWIIIPFSGSYSKFKKVKASKESKKDRDEDAPQH